MSRVDRSLDKLLPFTIRYILPDDHIYDPDIKLVSDVHELFLAVLSRGRYDIEDRIRLRGALNLSGITISIQSKQKIVNIRAFNCMALLACNGREYWKYNRLAIRYLLDHEAHMPIQGRVINRLFEDLAVSIDPMKYSAYKDKMDRISADLVFNGVPLGPPEDDPYERAIEVVLGLWNTNRISGFFHMFLPQTIDDGITSQFTADLTALFCKKDVNYKIALAGATHAVCVLRSQSQVVMKSGTTSFFNRLSNGVMALAQIGAWDRRREATIKWIMERCFCL